LPRPARAQLNKKQKKGDEEGLEYRAAFNLLLDLCFGESLRAWAHVNNWFYLHAGARARCGSPHPARRARPRRAPARAWRASPRFRRRWCRTLAL
jgi:hypothetical protein